LPNKNENSHLTFTSWHPGTTVQECFDSLTLLCVDWSSTLLDLLTKNSEAVSKSKGCEHQKDCPEKTPELPFKKPRGKERMKLLLMDAAVFQVHIFYFIKH
jgi:hypothetical protein